MYSSLDESIVKEFWEGYNRLSEEQKKILVRRILEHHTSTQEQKEKRTNGNDTISVPQVPLKQHNCKHKHLYKE